ncbi:DUF5675 family protein [Tenacibaculum sp. nBUS_03]|uniref:DUF5675 family protein n=1 Tax=Tenacibaculum sp. nBUS_03 TaxID=3395320 RepID=UPI003EBFE0C8
MKAILKRQFYEDKQILSSLKFFNGSECLLSVKALELPDRGNQNSISCIPALVYCCELRCSSKYGWHYHVKDVPGRSLILIHFGNYFTDTRGCILVGNAFKDINGDGYRDVTSSKKTMKRILAIMPKEFELTILD